MKYIKQFEKKTTKLKKGEYIIVSLNVKLDNDMLLNINSFLENNIGQIVDKNNEGYIVKYEFIPDFMSFITDIHEPKFGHNTINIGYIHTPTIKHSTNKEKLLPLVQANKFNL